MREGAITHFAKTANENKEKPIPNFASILSGEILMLKEKEQNYKINQSNSAKMNGPITLSSDDFIHIKDSVSGINRPQADKTPDNNEKILPYYKSGEDGMEI